MAKQGGAPAEPFEMATAKAAFESTCNGCRSLSKVQQSPPRSEAEARELVARMVENGLNAELRKLEEIIFYHARPYKD